MNSEPFYSFSTNRPGFVEFGPTEPEYETQYADDDQPPSPVASVATGPLKLMIVFQAFDQWFFFVNANGVNPVFDNWDHANLALSHAWHVLKGNYALMKGHPRQTQACPGFQQAAIVQIPPVKG